MHRQRSSATAFVSAAFAAMLPGPVIAATGDNGTDAYLDEIVVVAHKDQRSVREIAANVTIISRTSLANDLATLSRDLFRYVPGVDYESAGTRFGAEGINIRGIAGNRVAVLIDGVPLSDQFDVGSFSNATRDFLDTGLIERLEVLHGPASALYGSSALGGVVAVTTPDPSDITPAGGLGGDAHLSWRGDDDSTHMRGSLAFQGHASGVMLGLSRRDGHEIEPAAAPSGIDTREYRRDAALIKFVMDDAFGNSWRASVLSQQNESRSALASLLGQDRFRSTTALEGDDRYRMHLVNLEWAFGAADGGVDAGVLRAYAGDTSVRQQTLDERAAASTPVSIDRFFSFDQDIAGVELNLWRDFEGKRTTHRLGVGIEYRARTTEEYRDGLSTDLASGAETPVILGEVFPLRDFPVSDTAEIAVFVEDTISIGEFTVIAGLRADRFELEPRPDAMYIEDYPFAEPVGLDESDISPKLGVIWNPLPDLDLYAQYAHGFRAPPYADANISLELPLFNFRAVPNPDLGSESSDGIDVGLRLSRPHGWLRLSAFHTRYDDFIESRVRIGTDPESGRTLFQSINLRATTIEGFEGAFGVAFGGERRALEFDVAAYYASGENDETGEPLNSVGPPQAVAGLTWRSASERTRVRLAATLSAAWDDRDASGGELFEPPGYAVFDLYLSRRLSRAATLRAALYNLADRSYWYWSEVRGLTPGDPVIPFISRAGRSASVSLDVRF